MSNPWERQDTDTAASFEAFQIYRDLGPTRSLTKVVQQLNKSKTLLGRWSGKFNWVERAEAYDQYMDQMRLQEEEEARRIMHQEHAAINKLMLQVAKKRIETIKPEELSPNDVKNWVEVGMKNERIARGESTEDNKNSGNTIVQLIDNMHEMED